MARPARRPAGAARGLRLLLACAAAAAAAAGPGPARTKTVTGCLMVKDEAHVLEGTLESLRPHVDRFDITDTGSTDGTPDLVRAFLRKHGLPGEVYHYGGATVRGVFHFGDHAGIVGGKTVMYRNCVGKADYLFTIDADDLIVGDFRYPEPMDKMAYDLPFRGEQGHVYFNRDLLRADVAWRALGILHELEAAAPAPFRCPYCYEAEFLAGDYYILNRRKSGRNKNAFKYLDDAAAVERALREEPEGTFLHDRYVMYLGQSYRDASWLEARNEDHWRELKERALAAYLKRAAMGAGAYNRKEDVFESLWQAAQLRGQLGHPVEQQVAQYMEAYNSDPRRAEPLHALSRLYRGLGMPAVAFLFAKAGLELRPEPRMMFVKRSVYEEGILDEVCATGGQAGGAAAMEEGARACARLLHVYRAKGWAGAAAAGSDGGNGARLTYQRLQWYWWNGAARDLVPQFWPGAANATAAGGAGNGTRWATGSPGAAPAE